VRALCEGVNTCVRASGTVNTHNSTSDALESAVEMILHRVPVRLALPTGERRAVVSDYEL
jgi:hypothetical protein